jgi:hypothetical protein
MKVNQEPGLGFSFDDYAGAVNAFKSAGYKVSGFRDFLDAPAEKHLIMRHDCDNSIDQAMRIAHLDAELSITSTFFVRVHAVGYNLMSLPVLSNLRRIEQLGHQVELHLEGGIPEVLGKDMDHWADMQREVFRCAMQREPEGFSSHEPARMGNLNYADSLVERWGVKFHAYEDRFTMPTMKYLSDSSANWREGHFRLWVDKVPQLQVLTHPIWWFEKVPQENY